MLENLEPRLLLSVSIPEMYMVDPAVDHFDGQVIYLNFDGAADLTYNGPETVDGVHVPAYQPPAYLDIGRQDAIDCTIAKLNSLFFAHTGITFATTQPTEGEYSTVHIGGTGSEFHQWSSFIGLAEQVDIGNETPDDMALVFSDNIPEGAANAEQYLTGLAQIIAHEAARLLLLGFAEIGENIDRGRSQSWSDVNLNLVEVEVDGQTSSSTSGSFDVDQNKEIYLYSSFKNFWSGNGGVNISVNAFSGTPVAYSWTGNAGKDYYAPGSTIWHKDGHSITSSDPMVEGYEDGWGNFTWETETLGFKVNTRTDSWFEFQTRAWVDTTYVPSSGPNDQQGYDVYVYDIYVQTQDTEGPYAPGNPDLHNSDDSGWSNTDNITNDQTPRFSWIAPSDRGSSGVNGYYYSFTDPSPDSNDSWTTSTSITALSQSDGDRTIYVRAIDNVGNYGDVASLGFTIDTTPPTTSSLLSPGNGSSTSDQTPTFDWANFPDSGSGVDHYKIEVYNAGMSLIMSDTIDVSQYTPSLNIPYGTAFWQIHAIDYAGNPSNWAGPWTFVIGPIPTPPVNPDNFNSNPPVDTLTNDNTVVVSWSGAYDDVALDRYHYRWTTDLSYVVDTNKEGGDPYVNTSSGSGLRTSPELSDHSNWYFCIRYVDNDDLPADDTTDYGPFMIELLPGDADRTGVVNADDLGIFVSTFGQTGDVGSLPADFNRDRRVDLHDFAIMRGNFGSTLPAPAAAAASEAPLATLVPRPQAADELIAGATTPMVPVVSHPPDDNDSNDDSFAAIALASAIDLLVESPGSYIPEPQSVAMGSSANTLYHAATAEYDLRTLSDDLPTGSSDGYPGDGLRIRVGEYNPFPDLLAESLVAIPL